MRKDYYNDYNNYNDYNEYEEVRPSAGDRAVKYTKNIVLLPVWGASKITGIALRACARVINIVCRIIMIILVGTGILSLIFGICDFGTTAALLGGALGMYIFPRIIYALGNGFTSVGDRVSNYWHEPPKVSYQYNDMTSEQINDEEQAQLDAEYEIAVAKYNAMMKEKDEKKQEEGM